MCFYYDGDGIPMDWCRETIIVGRKVQICHSCDREIAPGEQQVRSKWNSFSDERPERYDQRICNQCCQDRVAIHRHELRVGCREENSWCPWGEIADAIRNGDRDEFREEFEGDHEGGVALFWPYGVPPAMRAVDLRRIPELSRSLVEYNT